MNALPPYKAIVVADTRHANRIAEGLGLNLASRSNSEWRVITLGQQIAGLRFDTIFITDAAKRESYDRRILSNDKRAEIWLAELGLRLKPRGRIIDL